MPVVGKRIRGASGALA